METDNKNEFEKRASKEQSRLWPGLLLLVIGGLLFARQSGADLPDWIFTWQLLLMAIGLFIGIRNGFRDASWLIMIAVGGLFLVEEIYPDMSFRKYLWPMIFMIIGLFIILQPRIFKGGAGCSSRWKRRDTSANSALAVNLSLDNDSVASPEDQIDVTAIFGGVKKHMLSKNFKGGEIVTFMGGTEINLSHADFNGKITLESFNMFGGTKLIVPPNWDVRSEAVSIFGGIDDKREIQPENTDPKKILVLDGTCIFGGIEIRSY